MMEEMSRSWLKCLVIASSSLFSISLEKEKKKNTKFLGLLQVFKLYYYFTDSFLSFAFGSRFLDL